MGSSGSRWDAGVATIVSSGHISVPLASRLFSIHLHTQNGTSSYVMWRCRSPSRSPSQIYLSWPFQQQRGIGPYFQGVELCFECHIDPESTDFCPSHLVASVLEEIVHEGRNSIRVSWKMQGVSYPSLDSAQVNDSRTN
jgi:hypothetical protein